MQSLVQVVSEIIDLSNFQRGQIMGAHLVGVLRTKVFMIMTAYTQHCKTSSAKKIVGENQGIHLEDSISTKNDHRTSQSQNP